LATKGRGPWTLVFQELHETKAEAYKRELEIKGWKSRVRIAKLIDNRSKGRTQSMAKSQSVQYISDLQGNQTAVIVPIGLWREITSEAETAYLLKNPKMRQRLLEAMGRSEGLSLDNVKEKLGI
jgi:hypothetical protein